jgi:hypothetical protein
MSTTKRTKKLTLNRETILELDRGELEHANGGIGDAFGPSH